jgi:uncharacterized protein YjbI with pentapeptide repeats
MDTAELKKVIDDHAKWLRGEGEARANLTGADLTGANLTGANLTGAYLGGADLTGANLASAYLTGANLAGAYLTGANLTGADLTGAYLGGADLARAKLNNGAVVVGLVARITRIIEPYEFFAWRTEQGDYVKAGCRFLTVAQYRDHAATYSDDAKRAETLAILDFIQARFDATKSA